VEKPDLSIAAQIINKLHI